MIDVEVLDRAKHLVEQYGLQIQEVDNDRPWGGEFIFSDSALEAFAKAFMPNLYLGKYNGRLAQPKFLFIAPHKRFSWQYHYRRGELWRVVEGPVGLIVSKNDEQPAPKILQVGETVELESMTRHRLSGLENWAIVAELWLHADLAEPSNEEDIVRVEDDFGRH